MLAARQPRLGLLDALRGIAALAVVLFHLQTLAWAWPDLHARMPSVLRAVMGFGVGVPVFFTLSGFVIACSIGARRIDGAFVGRFVLRRSLRLDPPYWASMALTIAVGAAIAVAGHRRVDLPTAGSILAHVTYTQDVLGLRPIAVVYWTLSLEIQFYVLLVLVGWAGRGAPFVAAAAAVAWPLLGLPLWPGSFLPWWHTFLLGAAVYEVAAARPAAWRLLALVAAGSAAVAVRAALDGRATDAACTAGCLATAALILVAARRGGLATWCGHRPFRWLGEVSYSLYLTHTSVLTATLALLTHLPGPKGLAVQALRVAIAAAAALLAARLMWRWVEVPSQALARRVRFAPRAAVAARPPEPRAIPGADEPAR